MTDSQRKQHIEQAFIKHYGTRPTLWVQAPGRVDLMGSHTDYNEGYVLTEAIERNTWIAARPRNDGMVRVRSLNTKKPAQFSLQDISYDTKVNWSNYVRGVAHVLQAEGYSLTGFDGLIHSTIPFSSGLSSSAALEVAVAILFQHMDNLKITKLALAQYCQRAENEFVGLDCGILDQYSSLMGLLDNVLLLDCRTITSEVIPIAADLMVMICDTKAKRTLTASAYSERRAACEEGVAILKEFIPEIQTLRDVSRAQFEGQRTHLPEVVARRCQFIIEENRRVIDLAAALQAGNRLTIHTLTAASFQGARDLYEISCPEMSAMMAAMSGAPGVIGARQAGAGFGGCMVAIIEKTMAEPFSQHVIRQYGDATSIETEVYHARASRGAGILPYSADLDRPENG